MSTGMKQELLCTWLGLPTSAWPPDPWTLLGLPRGEHDLGRDHDHLRERAPDPAPRGGVVRLPSR